MNETLVRIFYLGTNYHGSQWQPGIRTIHGELINALSQWQGSIVPLDTVCFAGRTDKGVHSLGQLVLIKSESLPNIDSINRYLPPDIIIWAYRPSPQGFRPRFDTLMRHYRYFFERNPKLNLDIMREAIQHMIGTHNFYHLSKPDGDRPTIATILNMFLADNDDFLFLDVIGTNFLWKLVRKIVTLITQIGLGIYPPSITHDILNQNAKLHGGIEPAPPEGLFLMESIIPLAFKTNKYALRKIRSLIKNKTEFLKRQLISLNGLSNSVIDHLGLPF